MAWVKLAEAGPPRNSHVVEDLPEPGHIATVWHNRVGVPVPRNRSCEAA